MKNNLEDFMDNREKRIAFAFMALESTKKKKKRKKFKQPDVENKFAFYSLLFLFILGLLILYFK